jgi:hypothetical protein
MRTSVAIEGSVTRITLDDGKVNAMSAARDYQSSMATAPQPSAA